MSICQVRILQKGLSVLVLEKFHLNSKMVLESNIKGKKFFEDEENYKFSTSSFMT